MYEIMTLKRDIKGKLCGKLNFFSYANVPSDYLQNNDLPIALIHKYFRGRHSYPLAHHIDITRSVGISQDYYHKLLFSYKKISLKLINYELDYL